MKLFFLREGHESWERTMHTFATCAICPKSEIRIGCPSKGPMGEIAHFTPRNGGIPQTPSIRYASNSRAPPACLPTFTCGNGKCLPPPNVHWSWRNEGHLCFVFFSSHTLGACWTLNASALDPLCGFKRWRLTLPGNDWSNPGTSRAVP